MPAQDVTPAAMQMAGDLSPSVDVLSAYEQFCSEREKAIIGEIRRVCGVPNPK